MMYAEESASPLDAGEKFKVFLKRGQILSMPVGVEIKRVIGQLVDQVVLDVIEKHADPFALVGDGNSGALAKRHGDETVQRFAFRV